MRESIIGLGVFLVLTPLGWGQAIDRQVLDQIQDATVFVKLKVPQVGEGSGSGFVIKATGDTVLVMTNRHVVVPEEGEVPEGAKFQISVVFRSGTPQQQELPAQILAHDDREVRDLAVLEVRGVKLSSPTHPGESLPSQNRHAAGRGRRCSARACRGAASRAATGKRKESAPVGQQGPPPPGRGACRSGTSARCSRPGRRNEPGGGRRW